MLCCADKIAASTPTFSKEKAIAAAEKAIGAPYNNFETKLAYVLKADHSAALAHGIQVQDDAASVWGEAFIDAHSGELISFTDYVAKATYRVLPIQKEVLTQGFETLTNPEDTTSSPYGWLRTTSTGTDSTTTQGNNAFAYVGSTGASQSSSGSFVYTQVPSSGPTVAANKNAATVNAFYLVNTIHDITYKYGFTEKAYNFQNTQIAAGGKGADRVKISVQDNGGTDNANFATPPDGQSGQMRMYLWDYTSPGRDGALENDIVTHE
jgi:extracellular elastinolytic metalloproteinase